MHRGAGCGWPHTSRAGHDPWTPGSLRRRPVRVASTCRSARPWAVLPARADAGRPAQVDRADGDASGGGAPRGAAPLRCDQPMGPRPVRQRLAELLVGAPEPTAWVVDDTSFPRDGDHSVGMQRQYSGTLGKTANCQLGVSVSAVTDRASCPLDWRLFVPESWDEPAMAARRAACHLPEQVHHRPKWQLVVDMLDELAAWGLGPPVLLADSAYGDVGEFRWGWRAARSATWWRSAPTPWPTPSTYTLSLRGIWVRGAVPGRATTTSRPRLPSWPWRP